MLNAVPVTGLASSPSFRILTHFKPNSCVRGVRGTVHSFMSAVRMSLTVSLLLSCLVADEADGSDNSETGVKVEVRGVESREG